MNDRYVCGDHGHIKAGGEVVPAFTFLCKMQKILTWTSDIKHHNIMIDEEKLREGYHEALRPYQGYRKIFRL